MHNEKQHEDNTKLVNFRMPISLYDQIEELAKRNERTVSAQMRFMLSQYIKLISTQ